MIEADSYGSRRVLFLKILLPLALISGFLLSIKLWVSSRSFPLSPVADWLPVAPFPFDYILFISLIALLILIALAARPRIYIAAFLFLIVLLGLTDQARWQPWVYQYVFMLAAMCFYSWNSSDEVGQRALLNACRVIVASIYVWSGVQKLNFTFINKLFPSLVNPYLKFVFGVVDITPRFLIISAAIVEASIGIGLLTRRFRKLSVWLALLQHLFILLLFIPVKRNSVIWPWNIAMASFVLILFWQANNISMREILLPKRLGFHALAVILFAIMPIFSFFGLWDSYLSSTLYSGNVAGGAIYFSESVREHLPPAIQSHVQISPSTGKPVISPNNWSLTELNVPVYPERRILFNITKHICAYAENPSEVSLKLYGKPNLWNGAQATTIYSCNELR
ncbi:MAG TPA: hypothetical protein VF735_06645 [Pyrinomonadaceae bacterium]|jgi:hypothetical protein